LSFDGIWYAESGERHLLKVIANSAADALLYDLLIALTVSSVNVAMPTVVDM
jgi:hypothetical protein